MTTLADEIVDLHRALAAADVPHAFGGALALAWCTARVRGTVDIDLNVFLGVDELDRVLTALPGAIERPVSSATSWCETPRPGCGGAARRSTCS